MYEAGEFPSIN